MPGRSLPIPPDWRGPQPVPNQRISVTGMRTDDGTPFILLSVSDDGGIDYVHLALESAAELGENLYQIAQRMKSGLILPPSAGGLN